jgi:hypothetical protein
MTRALPGWRQAGPGGATANRTPGTLAAVVTTLDALAVPGT